MIVAAHRTPRKLLEEALNVMDPAKLIGLVFNGDDRRRSDYHGYYYYGSSTGGRRGSGWWRTGNGHESGNGHARRASMLNKAVTAVNAEGVEYGGKALNAGTVIWAAGVLASPAAKWLGIEADRAGRVTGCALPRSPGRG